MRINISIHNKYVTLLVTLLLSLSVCSQQTDHSIVNTWKDKITHYPSELIYIQTSKGIYETGEDLWFKAYQLDAQTLGLSSQSRTLYLQMIGEKDSIIWQEKYPVEKGITSGHVYLDEKLPEGDYFLEAYTSHSFYNDSTRQVYIRKIHVVKNIARIEQVPLNPDKQNNFRFVFLPEGGNLITGIPSRIAFKATDGKGNPTDISGSIYQDNELVLNFETQHDGMGSFMFLPQAGSKYHVQLNNGKRVEFPEIHPRGMALQLTKQSKEYIEFYISQSEGSQEQKVTLIGQLRGMVCCKANGVLKDFLRIKIPQNNFSYQGIAEFTLFNEAMQPVAERLVYVHPEKKLHITLEPDKQSYLLREKATIKIKVTDNDNKPVKANLGLSIFDENYSNPKDPVNILTHCYLSSQIRGRIYDPAYYFNEANANRLKYLDLLLLTQGWRRYVWDIEKTQYKGQMFLTDGITGIQTIKSKKKSEKLRDLRQIIQVSSADNCSMFIETDTTGHFIVTPTIMQELSGGYLYLKPMMTGTFKPKLAIDDPFQTINKLRKQKPKYYPFIDLIRSEKNLLLDLPIVSGDSTILLDEVTIVKKARKPLRDKFMGRLDSLAQMEVGPWVCQHGFLENYRDGYSHRCCSPCPLPHFGYVEDTINVKRKPIDGKAYNLVKYIDPGRADGKWIIEDFSYDEIYYAHIYTEEELLRMNNLWRTKGYYPMREFYQPDETDIQLSVPDARNTLLWLPSVITDEKGEAIVNFYCSDINARFVIQAEAVDGLGLLGTTEYKFQVIRKAN